MSETKKALLQMIQTKGWVDVLGCLSEIADETEIADGAWADVQFNLNEAWTDASNLQLTGPKMPEFKEIVVHSKKIKGLKVSLNFECKEGLCGEYNPKDPKDVPLLRFDVSKNGEELENASFCTCLHVTDDRKALKKAAEAILGQAEKNYKKTGWKKAMEYCSLLNLVDGKIMGVVL